MGSRNESRATGAIAQLKAEGVLEGKGQVVYLPLDLSTPAQARAGAEEFMRRENRLDVLGEWKPHRVKMTGVWQSLTIVFLKSTMLGCMLSDFV